MADSGLLVRNTSRPPGRRIRAASPIQASGLAPRRGTVLADHEVGAAVGQRHVLGVGLQQREAQPVLGLRGAG